MNSSNNKTNQNVNTKEFQDGSISIWDIIIGIIIGVVISAIGFCWLKKYRKTNSKSKESTQKITAEDKALTTEVKMKKKIQVSINLQKPLTFKLKKKAKPIKKILTMKHGQ